MVRIKVDENNSEHYFDLLSLRFFLDREPTVTLKVYFKSPLALLALPVTGDLQRVDIN